MADHWRTQRASREYVNRYFPPQSILAEPASTPNERSQFVQAAINCAALLVAFLFLAVTGFSIPGAIFLLFVGG
jgi:hypothetical protein